MSSREHEQASPPRAAGKLVVIGAPHAGKSTLIARLCRRAINLEVGGRTVAMDHGMLEVAGRRLSVVGVPGQTRFTPVQEALVAGAFAAVWVRRFPWSPDARTAALAATIPAPRILFLNQTADEAELAVALGADDAAHVVIRGDLLAAGNSGREALLAALAALLRRRDGLAPAAPSRLPGAV